jgi:hypothetical protein
VRSIDLLEVVHAQNDKAPPKVPAKVEEPKPTGCDESHYECVSPGISTGTAAFGTVLANRIASDQLMVNGYDPLKLHDATLSALQSKGILTALEVQRIVEAGKVAKPLRVRQ